MNQNLYPIGVSSDGGPVAFSIVPVNQVASPETYLPMNQISFVEKNESSTLLPALTVLKIFRLEQLWPNSMG